MHEILSYLLGLEFKDQSEWTVGQILWLLQIEHRALQNATPSFNGQWTLVFLKFQAYHLIS